VSTSSAGVPTIVAFTPPQYAEGLAASSSGGPALPPEPPGDFVAPVALPRVGGRSAGTDGGSEAAGRARYGARLSSAENRCSPQPIATWPSAAAEFQAVKNISSEYASAGELW